MIPRSVQCSRPDNGPDNGPSSALQAIAANLATLGLEPWHGPVEHEGVKSGRIQTINKLARLGWTSGHPVMDPKPTALNPSLNICNNPEGYTDQQQASATEIDLLQLHHLPSSRHFPCRHPATNNSIVEGEQGALHGSSRGHRFPRTNKERDCRRRCEGGGRGKKRPVQPATHWQPARNDSRLITKVTPLRL